MSIMPETPDPVAPPQPAAVPTPQTDASGTSWTPVGAGWVYTPPPPPRRSSGRLVAIVLGVVAVAAAVVVTAGLIIGPRLVRQPHPQSTGDLLAVPEVGACYEALMGAGAVFNGGAETDTLVPCDRSHLIETIASGRVDGADPEDWPVQSDELTRDLFARCEESADRFLGGHWHMTYTRLVLSIPGKTLWGQGANWYRCDLAAIDDVWGDIVPTRGSLRETAQPITCVSWVLASSGESIERMSGADCDGRHEGEYAGAYRASTDHDHTLVSDEDIDDFNDGCWPVVLDFLGQDELADELTFWFYYPNRRDDLDQTVVCIVAATDGRTFDASVEGIGSAPLPFA